MGFFKYQNCAVAKKRLGNTVLRDIKATISVKSDVPPKFYKSRPLPFAVKEHVEKEIDRLEKVNIISPAGADLPIRQR